MIRHVLLGSGGNLKRHRNSEGNAPGSECDAKEIGNGRNSCDGENSNGKDRSCAVIPQYFDGTTGRHAIDGGSQSEPKPPLSAEGADSRQIFSPTGSMATADGPTIVHHGGIRGRNHDGATSSVRARFLPPTAPMAVPTQKPLRNLSAVLNGCCTQNLRPAPLPHDPIGEWGGSTQLEKETAWLLEESDVILPPKGGDDDAASQEMPLLLNHAWKHGTLRLRQAMWERFPSEISALLTNESKRVIAAEGGGGGPGPKLLEVDGRELIRWLPRSAANNFCRLREEARRALRLGYRRSESIERELNVVLGSRRRDAVEEMGDPRADKYWIARPKRSRHRRRKKRVQNEALLQTAMGQDRDSSFHSLSAKEMEENALNVPSELTELEDEIAWLVEESLIVLPADMINNESTSLKQISAGLVTKSADVKWDYVKQNASKLLNDHFERIGGIKRRPLQRIIRYTNSEVRCAFQTRRDEIASLLLLKGYRREQTRHSVPSHELLVQTGLDKVWAVRLMRRRQRETAGDRASTRDLRSACNARLADKDRSSKSQRRPKIKRKRATHAAATFSPPQPSETGGIGITQKGDHGAAILKILRPPEADDTPATTEKDNLTASSEKSQHPVPGVGHIITQKDHMAASLEKPQPPELIRRTADAQKAQSSMLTTGEDELEITQKDRPAASLEKSQSPEPIARLAVTQKAQSPILTAVEEELAWLREEYEFETGAKRYNWEYIERNSSLPLLIQLAEKRCAPSNFPSVAGTSKLRAMVRIDVPNVKEAFDAKRRDIQHAITALGFRRDRGEHLPGVPSAPSSFGLSVVRKNGTCVLDIEYVSHGVVEDEVICIDDDSDIEVISCEQPNNNGPPRDNNTLVDDVESATSLSNCGDIVSEETNGAKTKKTETQPSLFECGSSEIASMPDRRSEDSDEFTDDNDDDESEDEVTDNDDDDEYQVSSEEESEDDDF